MKRILALLFVLLIPVYLFASVGVQNSTGKVVGQATDIKVDNVSSNGSTMTLYSLGWKGGQTKYTTIATGVTPITASHLAYSILKKEVSSEQEVGTLANGTPGQYLVVICTALESSGTYTCTPTTKTGFTSFQLNTALDSVTLIYVDDVTGWVIIANNGATVA